MSGRGRAVRARARLGDRDFALLESLRDQRLMTGEQLRRLYLPDGEQVTQARKMRRTLSRLTELGVVVRLNRQIGGVHSGSEGHVYGLSGRGYAVLDQSSEGRRHRAVTEGKLAFQDHVLAVSELCVSMHEHSRRGAFDLLDFQAEPDCWRRYTGSGGQLITLKPDAFVRLGVGAYEVSAFIEQDLSSESLPTIYRKSQRYVEYWRCGIEQHQHGVFPAVWWLVPDQKRLNGVVRTLRTLAHDVQALFRVALTSEAVTLLGSVPDREAAS
jgi:hypothetical protein